MHEFHRKRKVRRILYSPLTIVILLVVVLLFAKATWNVYAKEVESRTYLSQAQDQLNKVATTQSGLATSVAALQTEEGVETDIRSQFLVAKPGEQVAVIVDGDDDDSGNADADANASDTATMADMATSSPGFWGHIVDFFKF